MSNYKGGNLHPRPARGFLIAAPLRILIASLARRARSISRVLSAPRLHLACRALFGPRLSLFAAMLRYGVARLRIEARAAARRAQFGAAPL
jgi:hypothetical protein